MRISIGQEFPLVFTESAPSHGPWSRNVRALAPRWAQETNQMQNFGKAWLGQVSALEHQLVLGFPRPGLVVQHDL